MYRSVLAALTIATAASPAAAEPSGGGATGVPESAAPRASLEAVLPGSQALIHDRASGQYLVVRVGDSFQGYRISALDRDQIVLTAASGSHFVLPLAPVATLAPAPAAPAAAPTTAVPLAATNEPIDPYADTLPADHAVEIHPAPAPTPAPAPVLPEPPVRVSPMAPAPAPAPAVPAGPRLDSVRLERSEFDAALGDFPSRSREIRIEVEAGKGIRLRDVARGSIFDRLGLRAGDLVRSVAGIRVVSVDDAAQVYARVLRADSFVIELDRGGAALDLRVELTRTTVR